MPNNAIQERDALLIGKQHLEAECREKQRSIDTLVQQRDELLLALKSVMRTDVKGHELQDRLQFSPAGRAILDQALAAIGAVNQAREGGAA